MEDLEKPSADSFVYQPSQFVNSKELKPKLPADYAGSIRLGGSVTMVPVSAAVAAARGAALSTASTAATSPTTQRSASPRALDFSPATSMTTGMQTPVQASRPEPNNGSFLQSGSMLLEPYSPRDMLSPRVNTAVQVRSSSPVAVKRLQSGDVRRLQSEDVKRLQSAPMLKQTPDLRVIYHAAVPARDASMRDMRMQPTLTPWREVSADPGTLPHSTPVQRIPKDLRLTFGQLDGESGAVSENLANFDFDERSKNMRIACEQAKLRERFAEAVLSQTQPAVTMVYTPRLVSTPRQATSSVTVINTMSPQVAARPIVPPVALAAPPLLVRQASPALVVRTVR